MFLLFINSCLYADDLKIYYNIKTNEDCHHLQCQINQVSVWCFKNYLEINITKHNVLSCTSKANPIMFTSTYHYKHIPRCDTLKDLGFSELVIKGNTLMTLSRLILSLLLNPNDTKTWGFLIRNAPHFSTSAITPVHYGYVQ